MVTEKEKKELRKEVGSEKLILAKFKKLFDRTDKLYTEIKKNNSGLTPQQNNLIASWIMVWTRKHVVDMLDKTWED